MTVNPAVLARVVSPDGAQWAYLDALSTVHGLSYTWDYPGGPTSAECSLDLPATAHVPALTIGSTFTLHRGASTVWAGRVSTVDRDGWRIQADGLGGLATRETASTTGTLDAIVDAAISDGLPWTRPATLGSTNWDGGEGGQSAGDETLDAVLEDVLIPNGKQWKVDVKGALTSEAQPTAPTRVIRADTAPPLTLNDYATHVTARYRSANNVSGTDSYSAVRVRNTTAAAKFGRVNRSIDLARFGVLTSAQATTYATNYLNAVSPQMTVSGDFQVQPGQLTTAAGAPVDLAHAQPGVVARIHLVSLVRDVMVAPTTTVDVLIGSTRYDVDSGVLTVAPAQHAADPLQVMLGARWRWRR